MTFTKKIYTVCYHSDNESCSAFHSRKITITIGHNLSLVFCIGMVVESRVKLDHSVLVLWFAGIMSASIWCIRCIQRHRQARVSTRRPLRSRWPNVRHSLAGYGNFNRVSLIMVTRLPILSIYCGTSPEETPVHNLCLS